MSALSPIEAVEAFHRMGPMVLDGSSIVEGGCGRRPRGADRASRHSWADLTDGRGQPLATEVSPGQSHESPSFADVTRAVRLRATDGRLRSPSVRVEADKGYSYGQIRAWLRRRKVEPVIPQRSDQIGGKGWLPARDEKLALNYLTMVKLAMIERCFRVLFRRSLAERGRRTTTGW